jgi:glycosyltransferase involved in cell wall biosynthesis
MTDFGKARLLAALPSLVSHFRRTRPQVVVSFLTSANILVALALRLAGHRARHVAVAQLAYDPLVFARLPYPRLRKAAAKWAYEHCDVPVAVSEGTSASMRDYLGVRQPVRVIFNPIFRDEIIELSREPVPEPWLDDARHPVLVNVGRLAPQKDQRTLLKAFARIRREVPARLLILGQGELEAELKELARELGVADAVRFTGFVKNPFAYVARADLFVLSSVREGLPGVLIEALALGCPVVSTDCLAGPKEILDDGRYGRLVPCGDDAALAQACLEALREKPDEARLMARARSYSAATALESYLAIFQV